MGCARGVVDCLSSHSQGLFAGSRCGRYHPEYISLVIHSQMSGAKGERAGFFLLPYGCFYALILAAEDFERDINLSGRWILLPSLVLVGFFFTAAILKGVKRVKSGGSITALLLSNTDKKH